MLYLLMLSVIWYRFWPTTVYIWVMSGFWFSCSVRGI